MKTRILATAVSAAALALTVAGCAKDDTSTTTDSGIELVKEGTLTICTHLPYNQSRLVTSRVFGALGQGTARNVTVVRALADKWG